MCGIVGVVDRKGEAISPDRLSNMTDVLAHRGPDGSGIWISSSGNVGLGHRRLSVIDVSSLGAQPMHSASGRYVLSYNGEVYNFAELRRELEGRGMEFRGHSDTEVILAAVEAWGTEEMLRRISGMFTIAIFDERNQELLIARDRNGIKPLYYSLSDEELIFASELRPIVTWKGSLPDISRQGLTEYLRLGYVPAPLSIFDDVHKLAPGTFIRFRNGGITERGTFWRYGDAVEEGRGNQFDDENKALDGLDDQLRRSVTSHMVSDVPIGAFLSGGIDSSLVVSLMQQQSTQPVKTFTIGFHEADYNEAEHAAAVARHLGTDHTELYVNDEDALAVVPQLSQIYDEPFADNSQIPTYLISKLAREDVTVALTGDGGDELFAGYNRYMFVANFWRKLQRLPIPARRLFANILAYPSSSSWDRLFKIGTPLMPQSLLPALPGQKMHKIATILPANSLLELHIRLVSQWINPQAALAPSWLSRDILWNSSLENNNDMSAAIQQSIWDAQTYMIDDILTKVDRASMAVGLEARVPLLDHEMVEFAWRVPAEMKLRENGGKWLLKQLLYRYVPRELVDRPKMGFGVPVDSWLRGALKDWAENYLDPHRLDEQGFWDAGIVRQTWEKHLSGHIDNGGPLWTVLMFQQWLDQAKKWA